MQPQLLPVILAPPSWMPRINGSKPSRFADFAKGRFWTGRPQPDFSSWLGSGTFSGSANGTYTNLANLLTQASANVPRIEAGGIRLEGARTQLLTFAGTFDDASWTKGNSTATSGITGPDGAASAYNLTAANSSAIHYMLHNVTVASGTTYAASASLKYNNVQWVVLRGDFPSTSYQSFDVLNGALGLSGASIINKSLVPSVNGFSRVSATWAATASGSGAQPLFGLNTSDAATVQTWSPGDATHGVYVHGLQVEAGAFASSYIPAPSGSTVTRAADSLTRTRTSPTVITKFLAGKTPPGVATEQIMWSADDGTTANRLRVTYKSDGHLHVIVTTSSSDVADLDMGAVAVNTNFKLAFRAQTDDYAASLNGAAVVTDSAGTMPAGVVNDRLGAGLSAGQEWFSTVSQDAEFSIGGSNSELQRLTN